MYLYERRARSTASAIAGAADRQSPPRRALPPRPPEAPALGGARHRYLFQPYARGTDADAAVGPRGGGAPLPGPVRARMEPALGQDLGHVRVHTGGEAARAAGIMRARAFTTGPDVVFGAGEYAPDTPAGARLLAHELVHVAQQGRGARAAARPDPARPALSRPGDAVEREAERVADRLFTPGAGPPSRVTPRAATPRVMRQQPPAPPQQRDDVEAIADRMDRLPGWLIQGNSGSGPDGSLAYQEMLANAGPAERSFYLSATFRDWFFGGWRRIGRLPDAQRRNAVQYLMLWNTRQGADRAAVLGSGAPPSDLFPGLAAPVMPRAPASPSIRPTAGSAQLRDPGQIRGGWVSPAPAQPAAPAPGRPAPPAAAMRTGGAPVRPPPTPQDYARVNAGSDMSAQLAAAAQVMANPRALYHHVIYRGGLRSIVSTATLNAGAGTASFGGGMRARASIGPARPVPRHFVIEFTTDAPGSPRPYAGTVGAQWREGEDIRIRITRILMPDGSELTPAGPGMLNVRHPDGTTSTMPVAQLPD